jgi:hypothetical protein
MNKDVLKILIVSFAVPAILLGIIFSSCEGSGPCSKKSSFREGYGTNGYIYYCEE